MEHAEALLKSGELDACMEEVKARVRADGGAVAPRVFLFQLFCILGQWERARRQLYVLKGLDAGTIPMFQTYEPAIRCEQFRAAVFAGERSPLVFGEPAQWLADLASALQALSKGQAEAAEQLRDAAFEAAPANSGNLDGTAFEWIADADGRLGPALEVFLNGQYYWLPFSHVATVRMGEPEDLRDLAWVPAEFQWVNGGEAVGLIPARYPGVELTNEPRLMLARLTEWEEAGENLVTGNGQRTLVTDAGDHPLLSVREIRIGNPQDT